MAESSETIFIRKPPLKGEFLLLGFIFSDGRGAVAHLQQTASQSLPIIASGEYFHNIILLDSIFQARFFLAPQFFRRSSAIPRAQAGNRLPLPE
jgi:hypothetical protein